MDIPANTAYTIRAFFPAEVELYRNIRLEALRNHPDMFGSTYSREVAFTYRQWMERITSSRACCFGLFYDNALIGITGIVINSQSPDEAEMVQSYIRKPYRGLGLSSVFYEERLQWARERDLRRLVIGHRKGNIPVHKECERFGFRFTHTESRNWHDGSMVDIVYYELML